MVDFLVHWFDPDQLRSSQNEYGQAALLALDRDEVGGLVRQLTALPESRRPSLDLLGRVEDALAAACTGDAGPVMALPSSLRQAIELRAMKSKRKRLPPLFVACEQRRTSNMNYNWLR